MEEQTTFAILMEIIKFSTGESNSKNINLQQSIYIVPRKPVKKVKT